MHKGDYYFNLFDVASKNRNCHKGDYAPNFEKVGDILVSACPYVCTYVCTYSCSRYRLETSCMDSSWKKR